MTEGIISKFFKWLLGDQATTTCYGWFIGSLTGVGALVLNNYRTGDDITWETILIGAISGIVASGGGGILRMHGEKK